jgi:23S rRNA (cytidine1920-2'-O)/16S rRNA (cytidine1409-2'-O)-methyltransferase
VNGIIVTNPDSMTPADASITLCAPKELRGEAKLHAALEVFGVQVAGRIAIDVVAAAGGFTRMLLREGAAKVYAVDAGYGELLGSLRAHPRVVNLERTNLGDLRHELVPDVVELLTVDVSYVSLASAIPQLGRLAIAKDADLLALVKPMFKLRLPAPPGNAALIEEALRRAMKGIRRGGWRIAGRMESPLRGRRGALELFLHAKRLTRGESDGLSGSQRSPTHGRSAAAGMELTMDEQPRKSLNTTEDRLA